jgi:hypothetical protein
MSALFAGLPDVTVLGVGDWPRWLRIVIETPGERPDCGCGRMYIVTEFTRLSTWKYRCSAVHHG